MVVGDSVCITLFVVLFADDFAGGFLYGCGRFPFVVVVETLPDEDVFCRTGEVSLSLEFCLVFASKVSRFRARSVEIQSHNHIFEDRKYLSVVVNRDKSQIKSQIAKSKNS